MWYTFQKKSIVNYALENFAKKLKMFYQVVFNAYLHDYEKYICHRRHASVFITERFIQAENS